jgi:hypothetical protein
MITLFDVFVLVLLVNPAIGFWVYLDATKQKIGKVRDWKSMRNMSAAAWGSIGLLQVGSWVIYLLSRRKLVSLARTSPSDSGKAGVTVVLLVLGYSTQLSCFVFIAHQVYFGGP